ncbi:MAG TPA: hypothetical protein VJR89_26800 [Polyangiales bacterium]|nr:hypothetical protein [Polyangiales bacterium]
MTAHPSSFDTELIPQADNLRKLRAVIEAIASGARLPGAIGDAAGLRERAARYHIAAARTLGWLELEDAVPALTPAGRSLLRTRPDSPAEAELMARAIDQSAALRVVLRPFVFDGAVTREELTADLLARTQLAAATAQRRAETLISWRRQLNTRGLQSATAQLTLKPPPLHAKPRSRPGLSVLTLQRAIAASTSVEAEIDVALAGLLSPADRDVARQWIDWEREEPRSSGRARLPRVATRLVTALRRKGLKLPKLKAAMLTLERVGFAPQHEVRRALLAERLATRPLSIAALLRAAELFGMGRTCEIGCVADQLYVGSKTDLETGAALYELLQRSGSATLDSIAGALKCELPRRLLDRLPNLRWLDEERLVLEPARDSE